MMMMMMRCVILGAFKSLLCDSHVFSCSSLHQLKNMFKYVQETTTFLNKINTRTQKNLTSFAAHCCARVEAIRHKKLICRSAVTALFSFKAEVLCIFTLLARWFSCLNRLLRVYSRPTSEPKQTHCSLSCSVTCYSSVAMPTETTHHHHPPSPIPPSISIVLLFLRAGCWSFLY